MKKIACCIFLSIVLSFLFSQEQYPPQTTPENEATQESPKEKQQSIVGLRFGLGYYPFQVMFNNTQDSYHNLWEVGFPSPWVYLYCDAYLGFSIGKNSYIGAGWSEHLVLVGLLSGMYAFFLYEFPNCELLLKAYTPFIIFYTKITTNGMGYSESYTYTASTLIFAPEFSIRFPKNAKSKFGFDILLLSAGNNSDMLMLAAGNMAVLLGMNFSSR